MLTDALYSGDREHRIKQELLLGVGGVRALAALGIDATVFHMNEGHSAFLAIERVRALVADGMSTADALAHVKRSTVFTTHTPVPAGNEMFDAELVTPLRRHARRTGGHRHRASCSRSGSSATTGTSGMTPMSLRLSAYANGVSKLHGEVAREMWAGLSTRRHRDRARHERRPPRHLARPGARRAAARAPASIPRLPPADDAAGTTSTRSTRQQLWDVHARREDASSPS